MPPFRKPNLVTLRRQQPNQAWGFRLGGGAEIGQPFQIQKVCTAGFVFARLTFVFSFFAHRSLRAA